MADLLEIKAVKSTNDKVDRVEFHPVQPWLVFVTRGNGVTVWNYESSEVRPVGGIKYRKQRFIFLFP